MLNIIERLDRSRFLPAVCVSKKGGDLDRVVDRLGIPFYELPTTISPRPYASLLRRARAAASAFDGDRFDIWHSFHYADDYTEPIVARMAGAGAWVFTKKNMGWGSRAWWLRSMLAARIGAQNSDMLRTFFARGPLRRKARPLPRGVVADRFSPETAPRLGLRSSLQISSSDLVVACVGHLVPVKGHPTLLRALADVPGVHLLVAGRPADKEYASSLERMVGELCLSGRVHFLGGVGDIAALHAEADVSVLPTWAKWRMEGCPVALLEAMSCGKACVATDIPGSRDLVEHERSGLLVPPEDPHALAAALRRLAASPEERAAFGAAARQRVLDRFTIEREVAAHEALYSEVLGLA